MLIKVSAWISENNIILTVSFSQFYPLLGGISPVSLTVYLPISERVFQIGSVVSVPSGQVLVRRYKQKKSVQIYRLHQFKMFKHKPIPIPTKFDVTCIFASTYHSSLRHIPHFTIRYQSERTLYRPDRLAASWHRITRSWMPVLPDINGFLTDTRVKIRGIVGR